MATLTVKQALNNGGNTDTPQLLGRMNIGSLLEKLVTPTIDADARTNITAHVSPMVNSAGDAVYGLVHTVFITAGGVTGNANIVLGTPANSRDVKLEYLSTGQPKLTFLAGDAVTGYKVHWTEHPPSRNAVTLRAELASEAA